jgi:3-hydroxy acid dehydrogenase / malonic semialdehyde reductase
MNKLSFITGATSGFGEAIARKFAANGHSIIITGRRTERLEALAGELRNSHLIEVLPITLDVRNRDLVAQTINDLEDKWKKIDILVNNAGLASGANPIQDGDIDDWERMIETNVNGLLYVSRAVIPFMVARGQGHIINIGSTAGKEVYKNGNVYCASKHAVDAITKGMRIDLLEDGIKVTQIAPGAAETEFSEVRFHGDKEKAKSVYNGYKPMEAQDIAELVYYSSSLPSHLCINDLVVTSLAQANSFYIDRK